MHGLTLDNVRDALMNLRKPVVNVITGDVQLHCTF